MRDPERIDRICGLLSEVWKKSPDLRLGQLIYNIVRAHKGGITPLFYIEDDELESIMRVHLPNKKDTSMEDKSIPQKVRHNKFGVECPRCGGCIILPTSYTFSNNFNNNMVNYHTFSNNTIGIRCDYCYSCGQALDWSE